MATEALTPFVYGDLRISMNINVEHPHGPRLKRIYLLTYKDVNESDAKARVEAFRKMNPKLARDMRAEWRPEAKRIF